MEHVSLGIGSLWAWGGFLLFVLAMLALDLGVFHRKAHVIRFREAAVWSAVWVSLAMLFNLGLWWQAGPVPATEFFTGYLIEKSLSVDNIFVFLAIFASLRIPALYQHRVLFWGILSAIVLRAIMIFAGVAALERFEWLIYVFGGFLILTGLRLLKTWEPEEMVETQDSAVVRLVRRVIPTTRELHGPHFLARTPMGLVATPLLLALVLVEVSDVLFALDSIPAIFAITRDPFIVFTSNIFAILGLRSMFFLLAGMIDRFRYLKIGLAAVLVFVGIKMVIIGWVHLPPLVSLAIIAALLGGAIGASLWVSRGEARAERAAEGGSPD